MTREQNIMLRLVLLGIGKAQPTEADARMLCDEAVNWPAVIDMTYRHNVPVIATDGYAAVKQAFPLTEHGLQAERMYDDRVDWVGLTMTAEGLYHNQRQAIRQLAKFYAKRGIDMMLLKGYGLSLNYPVPQHRLVGDIDIFLFGKWQEADEAIRQKGIEVKMDSEHHTKFMLGNYSVENHYDFVNTRIRRSSRSLERVFKDLAMNDTRTSIDIDGRTVFVPSPNLNALFLLRHTAGHFASEGIFLRHVLDWAFFVEKNSERVDWPWLYRIATEYNMHRFLCSLNAICIRHLGFDKALFHQPEDLVTTTEMDERVLNEILQGIITEGGGTTLGRTLRWWRHRWKHSICYSDSMLSSFLTSITANILPTSIK